MTVTIGPSASNLVAKSATSDSDKAAWVRINPTMSLGVASRYRDRRLRGDARGCDGGLCQELAAGMTIKAPLSGSVDLLHRVQERLSPNRLPLLIAIDGADGVGKSSLASWLAWQLGAPAIHLDLYLVRDSDPLQWRSDELQRILNTRLVEHEKPVVVEGILILEALGKIGRRPDFLVHVDGEGSHSLSNRLTAYRAKYQPKQRAQFRLQGFAD
jgi:hypothetical protein